MDFTHNHVNLIRGRCDDLSWWLNSLCHWLPWSQPWKTSWSEAWLGFPEHNSLWDMMAVSVLATLLVVYVSVHQHRRIGEPSQPTAVDNDPPVHDEGVDRRRIRLSRIRNACAHLSNKTN
jgi:hypothetical protein